MLGDSFCKLCHVLEEYYQKTTFNPHAWGLFLQGDIGIVWLKDGKELLSIPMLGDSFCKVKGWRMPPNTVYVFQSPCLGTLFASGSG